MLCYARRGVGRTSSRLSACKNRRVEARKLGRALGATWPLRRSNGDGAAGIWTCEDKKLSLATPFWQFGFLRGQRRGGLRTCAEWDRWRVLMCPHPRLQRRERS